MDVSTEQNLSGSTSLSLITDDALVISDRSMDLDTTAKPKTKRLLRGRTKHKAKAIASSVALPSRTSCEPAIAKAVDQNPTQISSERVEPNQSVASTGPKENTQSVQKTVELTSPKTTLARLASKADESRIHSDLKLHSTVSSSLDLLRKGLMMKSKNSAAVPSTFGIPQVPQTEKVSAMKPRLCDSLGGSISSIENTSAIMRSSNQDEMSFIVEHEDSGKNLWLPVNGSACAPKMNIQVCTSLYK